MRKTIIKGPAALISRAKEKKCTVSGASLGHELSLKFLLEDGTIISFLSEDPEIIDHIADVARMAKNRARRNGSSR